MIIFQCFRTPGKRGKLKEIYRALCVEGKRTKIGRKRENVSLMGNNSHHPTSLHQNFYKDYIYTRVESFRYITREYFLSTHARARMKFIFTPPGKINESRKATDPKLDSLGEKRGASGNGGSRAVVPQQLGQSN